jgi:ABC-type glycerol-3-phosphate transport system substrate-binding protein
MRAHRSLVRICILAVLLLVLAACAPAAPGQPAAEAPAEGEAGTASEEKITLEVWDTGTEYYQWVEDVAIPLFQEKYPNVEIIHTGIPYDQYTLKIDTAATAGDLPDLIADEVPGPNSKWYKAGLFIPLNEYMERDGIGAEDYCGLINTSIQMDGDVFMLPMFVNFWGMLYDKDKFAAAGLPELTPESVIGFEEWLEYARKLNQPAETLEERVWGTQMLRPDWNAMPAGMSDPYYLGADGRTCAGNADTPDMIRMWEIVNTAYAEDLTPETGQTLMGDADSWLFFTEGKVAMSFGDMSMATQAAENGINVGITGQPVVTADWPHNVNIYGMGYGITRASEHPDLAWEFVKLTSTIIPMELVDAKMYGEATAGIPCYQPIVEDYIAASENPFLDEAQQMIDRYQAPPFVPDFYSGSVPIWEEINVRVIEDGEDVATVVTEAMPQCQEAVDDMWEQYDSLQ